MFDQTTDQFFPQAVCATWQFAFLRNIVHGDDSQCCERVELSVSQYGIQSGHGAVDFSWADDASQPDAGNDRRKLSCVARGAGIAALFPPYGSVFAGATAIAGTVAGDADAANWAENGMFGGTFLAVVGTGCKGVRRLDGVDARHARKSGSVPAKQKPETGCRVSAGAHRSFVFAVDGSRVGSWHPQVGGKIPKRTGDSAGHVLSVRAGRYFARGPLSLFLHGNSRFAGQRRGFRGPHARPSGRGFSAWQKNWHMGSHRGMEKTATAAVDVDRRICRLARCDVDTRDPFSARSQGVSHAHNNDRNHTARREHLFQGGNCTLVRPALGCRNQSSFAQNRNEHGRFALPNSGNGSQRDLGPLAGVQPYPFGHGTSRRVARHAPATTQLHSSHANHGSLSTHNRSHKQNPVAADLQTNVENDSFP